MDVCGAQKRVSRTPLRLEELREARLSHALARHKATIIDSFFETYNKLLGNLSEEYYKQDIYLDLSLLDLNDQEVDTQIEFYRQNYLRYKEISLTFLSVKTLIDRFRNITQDI